MIIDGFFKDDAWSRIAGILDHIRSRYPKMTVGMFFSFICIARAVELDKIKQKTSNTSMKNIVTSLKVNYSTFARHTDELSDMGLVVKNRSDESDREKRLCITESGFELISEMHNMLVPDRHGLPEKQASSTP